MRDRLAAFLYWAAYWLERAADRLYYGRGWKLDEVALMDAAEFHRRRTAILSNLTETAPARRWKR